METENRRICRKCLTRDMDQAAYFKNLHDYIANLDEDVKVGEPLYEKRLSLVRNAICFWTACAVPADVLWSCGRR